jgi:hypothetical protein
MERFGAIPPSDSVIPGAIPQTDNANPISALVLGIALAAENSAPLLPRQLVRLLPEGQDNRL